MWFVLVFALLAVLLVIAGTMRIVRRRRAGLGHGRVFPAALEHPAPQRHGEAPPEASPSGGAFRGGGLGSTLKGLFHGGATEATWHELEDVRAARRDLLELIAQVDREITETFTTAYRDVAIEFERLVAELFPGGEGRLVLTDPASPL